MSATRGRRFVTIVFLTLALSASSSSQADPPDLVLNPVTGLVESVDIDTESGDRVRHVEGQPTALRGTSLLISEQSGANPRIACRSDGQTWVAWWHDGASDEVRFRYRDPATSEWTDEWVLSGNGRYPELVHSGMTTWIGYEADENPGVGIHVASVIDSPEPIDDSFCVATTDYTGDVAVMMHAAEGHVWVTWVDSGSEVGWSEYDATSETWSLPQYQPYYDGNVKAALDTIATMILGE